MSVEERQISGLIIYHYEKKIFIAFIICIPYTNQSALTLALTQTKKQALNATPKKATQPTFNTKRKPKSSINFFKKNQEEDLLRSLTQVGIFWGLAGGTYAMLGEPLFYPRL